jgi:hypothetical protein
MPPEEPDEPEPEEPEPDGPEPPEPDEPVLDEPCGFAEAPLAPPPERVVPVVSGADPERCPLDVVALPEVSVRVLLPLRTDTPERSRTFVPTPTDTPVLVRSRTVRRLRTDTLDDGSSVLCTTTRRPPRIT